MVEQVLDVAERHNYPEIVTEAFWVKANALWFMDRRREAISLVDAAQKIAEEQGMTDALLRIMNGRANVLSEFDLEAALNSYRDVMAVASANRPSHGTAITRLRASATRGFLRGAWDEAIAELEAGLAEDPRTGRAT